MIYKKEMEIFKKLKLLKKLEFCMVLWMGKKMLIVGVMCGKVLMV